MKDRPFVYLAISLTHVPSEERDGIRELVRLLKERTNFDEWAFDVNTWLPRPVDNVFTFDIEKVNRADLIAGVYFSSAGSDGRGGELTWRAMTKGNKGFHIYVREAMKVSPFITGMIQRFSIPVHTFQTVEELTEMIIGHIPESICYPRDATRLLGWDDTQ